MVESNQFSSRSCHRGYDKWLHILVTSYNTPWANSPPSIADSVAFMTTLNLLIRLQVRFSAGDWTTWYLVPAEILAENGWGCFNTQVTHVLFLLLIFLFRISCQFALRIMFQFHQCPQRLWEKYSAGQGHFRNDKTINKQQNYLAKILSVKTKAESTVWGYSKFK